jgi:hypothetical protein
LVSKLQGLQGFLVEHLDGILRKGDAHISSAYVLENVKLVVLKY